MSSKREEPDIADATSTPAAGEGAARSGSGDGNDAAAKATPGSLRVVNHKDAGRSYVSSTARATAALRAMESKRDDALINDPYAHALAGEEVGGLGGCCAGSRSHEITGNPSGSPE